MANAAYTVFEYLRLPVKYLSLLSILFPLVIGLRYTKNSEKWQRILLIYVIVGFFAEAISFLSVNNNRHVFFLTLNLFTIFEFILLLNFYRSVHGYSLTNGIFWTLISMWLVVSFSSLIHTGFYISNNLITTIEAICIIVCAISYPLVHGFNARTIILLVDFIILIYFATNFITSKYEKEIETDILLRRCIFTLQRIINIFFNLVIGLSLRSTMKNGIYS